MRIYALVGALALLCSSGAALAGGRIIEPGIGIPASGVCFGKVGTAAKCVDDTEGLPVKIVSGGAGGGAGDASAANQTTQIAAEQAIRDRIGATISPAAGTTNYLLSNGIVVNTHAVTQSGGWTVGVSGTVTTSSASAGTVGSAAPSTAAQLGGKSADGNLRAVATDATGVLASPNAGTGQRVVTKTNLSSNTSTTICPAATAPVSTEIFFSTAGVGISLSGGTLTTATIGTTANTTPDLSFSVAGDYYVFPVPPTNAITAYGAAGIVVCIQTLRQ